MCKMGVILTVSVIAILMIELLWQYQIDVVKRNGASKKWSKCYFYEDELIQEIQKIVEKTTEAAKNATWL